MGKQTRSVQRERTAQWKLDALIEKNKIETPPIIVEREHVEPRPVLFNTEEYDSLHPEDVLRNFCASIRDMISRYESDKIRYEQLEQEMQDVLHFIEMSENKNANSGFKLYKQLADIRRERRICKNEIELLQPVYSNFKETDLLNILTRVQGNCKNIKQQIDGRGYTVRTDVLKTFIEKG